MEQNVKKKDLIIFALIWALIFILIGLYPLKYRNDVRVWSLGIAGVFILTVLIRPDTLKGVYGIWIKVGEFIGGIVSKVIMFILYFVLFTPVSLVLKMLGKDLLRKKTNKNESTYWIQREIQPQSMKNQF